jgi:outer membrane murein-binding lipoprotein Lpp
MRIDITPEDKNAPGEQRTITFHGLDVVWTCPSCGHNNSLPGLYCGRCGAPFHPVFVHPASAEDMHHIKTALATLIQIGERTMSAISDFAAKQAAHNQQVSADLDALKQQISDLNTKIATLQNSPGAITPEDQATLDQIEAAGADLATKADALAGVTPPTPPAA